MIEEKAIRRLQMVSQANRLKAPIIEGYGEQYLEFLDTIKGKGADLKYSGVQSSIAD